VQPRTAGGGQCQLFWQTTGVGSRTQVSRFALLQVVRRPSWLSSSRPLRVSDWSSRCRLEGEVPRCEANSVKHHRFPGCQNRLWEVLLRLYMDKDLLLAIDVGTGSVRAALITPIGETLAFSAKEPHRLYSSATPLKIARKICPGLVSQLSPSHAPPTLGRVGSTQPPKCRTSQPRRRSRAAPYSRKSANLLCVGACQLTAAMSVDALLNSNIYRLCVRGLAALLQCHRS
jgi:hypothetical protein